MSLFDEVERTFQGPSDYNESRYNYYNRSARKDISEIRRTLNSWFDQIPSSDQVSFKSSLIKKFDDGFYELFLHALFKSLGFEVVIHPLLEHSTKRPDFLIKKGSLEIYVEAKISKDKSNKEEAYEKMKNQFYDSLNKIKSPNFLLAIEELDFISGRQPKTKDIIRKVEQELSKLDPEVVTSEIDKNGVRSVKIEYNDRDVHIVLNPTPVIKSARVEKKRRALGVFPIESYQGGGEEALRKSIELKANRYGELDKPFIVCVNALSDKTDSVYDIDNAIWGSLAISFTDNPEDQDRKWVRLRDGIFLDKKGPRHTNLSAVLITQIYPHNIPVANYWLYNNPFANYIIDTDKLALISSFVQDGYMHTNTGNNLDLILGINKDWLKK